jgi:hypothetical protein
MAIVLFASEVILGQLLSLRVIGSTGRVRVLGVGVFWDVNCHNPVYSLDWGIVEPGSLKNITIYIRNEGNEPATLFLNTTNWNPSNASDSITLTWDYNEYIISPDQTTKVTLMLSIAPTTEGIKNFYFDIIIGVSG